MRRCIAPLLVLLIVGACDDESPEGGLPVGDQAGLDLDLRREPIEPPFALRGDAAGLLLVWFDESGPHTADGREAIPEAHRDQVRVDSLRLPPEQRLDPDFVYLADLRAEEEGRYPVWKVSRVAFEALLDRAAGVRVAEAAGPDTRGGAPPTAADGDADVVIYGADWCGACRSAARFFEQRGIRFVEKNVERDNGALLEMQTKARRARVRPSGIPVIDFRGTILTGFDQARLESLIQAGG